MPNLTMIAPQRDVVFRRPERLERVMLAQVILPEFADAEIAKLGATPPQIASSVAGGKPWVALAGWVEHVEDPTKVVVLCRRTGLTVMVDAGPLAATAGLLPLAGALTAELAWKAGGEDKKLPFSVMLDLGRGLLTLVAPFANDAAGRALYDDVVAGLTTPTAQAQAVVAYTHTYSHRVTAPSAPVVRPPRGAVLHVDPAIAIRRGVGLERLARPAAAVPARPEIAIAGRHEAMATRVADLQPILRERILRGGVIFQPPAPTETTLETASLAGRVVIPLFRPRDKQEVFPDLPREAREGWGQVPLRKPPLHFRDSAEPDLFFHLPTQYRLGFGIEGERAGRPPMRADIYEDDTGAYRVKVTLVALPSMEQADRDALRDYLRHSVLWDTVPYVRLSPAAGVKAEFRADFTSGPATEATRLPAGIRFSCDAQPEKWLILQFDMEATNYAIFAAMLAKGLHGRVVLETEGVSQGVPVNLELDKILSDAVSVQVKDLDLSLDNLLDLPVSVASVRASLLDLGPVSGIPFDAEELDLAPGGALRLDKGARWSGQLVAQRIAGWDDTIVTLGPVRVEGGSPQDWLDRVNRDPSLQAHPFKTRVSLVVPSAGAGKVELVQLRLFKDGEAAPREEVRMVPGGSPLDLSINLRLSELMGNAGQTEAFYLEYETVHTDGHLSLAQRMTVRPGQKEVTLVALVEAPDSVYTVDYVAEDGAHRVELTRPQAVALLTDLKARGRRWQIFAHAPAPTPGPIVPVPDPLTPAPTGPAVSIITDLLGPAFEAGTLKKVFVVLSAATTGAVSTTIVFDPAHPDGQDWRPASGTIPPFKYQVTYLFASGAPRKFEGTEAGLTLVLDPPAEP